MSPESKAEGMGKELILVLGGARAGKSDFAEGLADSAGRVLFVATAEALDEDMAQRIAVHRSQRPAGWETLEVPVDVAASLAPVAQDYDTVLLDCLTLWVSNRMLQEEDTPHIVEATENLLRVYDEGDAAWIVVSNEVGLGVVPPTPSGRAFRDALGRVNQLVASRADRVYMMVAGIAIEIKGADTPHSGHSGRQDTT